MNAALPIDDLSRTLADETAHGHPAPCPAPTMTGAEATDGETDGATRTRTGGTAHLTVLTTPVAPATVNEATQGTSYGAVRTMEDFAENAGTQSATEPTVADTIARETMSTGSRCWIERLAGALDGAGEERGARLSTTLSCNVRNGRPMLFLPPEMGTLQPRNLAWLRGFARRHALGLVEDRRKTDLRPLSERRERAPDTLALGISLLLRQTGMPGGPRTLSSPHRLHADALHIGLDELVRMAAFARPRSKRVVLPPNRMIGEATGQETHPLVAHACRLSTARTVTVLSQVDSPAFRCIGYSTGRQYVVHVLLAAGEANAPELWTPLHALTRTDFRFRLFPAAERSRDFGLFHTTFHYDLAG